MRSEFALSINHLDIDLLHTPPNSPAFVESVMPFDGNIQADAPIAYDVVEAAKRAGVGRSKIFEEINAQRLKARKAGRRTLILHADLAAWAAALPQREVNTRKHAA